MFVSFALTIYKMINLYEKVKHLSKIRELLVSGSHIESGSTSIVRFDVEIYFLARKNYGLYFNTAV